MPLSEPSGGTPSFAPSGVVIIGHLPIQNTGADLSVNLQACSWDEVNSRILIGGNNDFAGTKASAYAKMQQATNLPASSNTCFGIVVNRVDSGVIYQDGANAVFRTGAAFPAWTTITPPAVTSRNGGCFTFGSDGNIYISTLLLAAPARDIEVSGDNGATWDSNPGLLSGVSGGGRMVRVTRDGSSLVAIGGSGEVAISDDPTNNASWEILTAAAAGTVSCMAFSNDNTKMIVCNNTGQVTAFDGVVAGSEAEIATANNPFSQTAGNGRAIQVCEYVAGLGGFVLISMTNQICGFIDEDDLTTIQQGLYLTDANVGVPSNFRMGLSAVDAAGDLVGVGSANNGAALVRFA